MYTKSEIVKILNSNLVTINKYCKLFEVEYPFDVKTADNGKSKLYNDNVLQFIKTNIMLGNKLKGRNLSKYKNKIAEEIDKLWFEINKLKEEINKFSNKVNNKTSNVKVNNKKPNAELISELKKLVNKGYKNWSTLAKEKNINYNTLKTYLRKIRKNIY